MRLDKPVNIEICELELDGREVAPFKTWYAPVYLERLFCLKSVGFSDGEVSMDFNWIHLF